MAWKRWIVLRVVAAGLAAGIAAGCGTSAQDYLKNGNALAAQGKHAEAIIEYRNAIQQDARLGEAHYQLAKSYTATNDIARATRAYIDAADLMPDNAAVQLDATRAMVLAGRFEDAAARASAVIARDPRNVDAHVAKAMALAGLSDFSAAVAQVDATLKLDPRSPESLMMRGALSSSRREAADAEAAFTKAVEVAPNSIPALQALANFYWSTGRSAEAERWVRRTIELNPRDVQSQRMLAALLLSSGRAAEAEAPLKAIASLAESIANDLTLADYYAAQGRETDARAALSRAANRPMGFEPATLRLARLEYVRNRPAEGEKALNAVLAKDPKNLDALVLRSQVRLAEDKLEEASDSARAAIAANPNADSAHEGLADVLARRNDVDGAIQSLTVALGLNPRNIVARLKLADLQLRKGEVGPATQTAEEAARLAPNNANVRLMVARTAAARGDSARAEQELTGILQAMPNLAAAHLRMGEVALARRDYAAARARLTRAAELDPTSDEVLPARLVLEVEDKRVDEARRIAEQAVAQAPRDVARLRLLADVYESTEDAGRQESTLNRIVELDPTNLDAFITLAQMYARRGQLDAARAKYEAVAAKGTRSAAAYTMVGMLFEAQKRVDEAMAAYQKALDVDRNSALAANNLAWLQAERGDNLDLSLQLAQTALRREPDIPEFNDTLGWIYLKKGLPGQAINAFETAIRLDPKEAAYHYHLGLAHKAAANRRRAREAFEAALKLRPQYAEAAAALKAL